MRLDDFLRACLERRPLTCVVAVVLAVACTSDEKAPGELAAGCLVNSDCHDPLVCAFRTCHNACVATRDCPKGLRCVASDRPYHVCQLLSERNCTYNTDCFEGQAC